MLHTSDTSLASAAYIAGMGIITSIGNNLGEHLQALQQKHCGIGMPQLLQTIHELPVGEIKLSNKELATRAGVLETLPRTALLSILAAKEAIAPFADKLRGLRIAFISANTVGGMDLTETEYIKLTTKEKINPRKVIHHECGSITELSIHALGLDNCWHTTISTACSSSANSIMLAARLIEQGKMDLVIAGGADALSKFTLNGFNSLKILDKDLCQPFDEHRRGLNLGEGAAYLVLMNAATVQGLGAPVLARLSGYANANDAYHQTASSPEGTGNTLAIQGALLQAGLQASDIDYINLHGTGTENNDHAEGMAIEKVFAGQRIPPASSTKCYTGHTLGAAGAVEAVFSVLAIQQQCAWPHLRLQTPISSQSWQPNTEIIHQPIRHVLSNSFGFGGNCTSLVISKE